MILPATKIYMPAGNDIYISLRCYVGHTTIPGLFLRCSVICLGVPVHAACYYLQLPCSHALTTHAVCCAIGISVVLPSTSTSAVGPRRPFIACKAMLF